MNPFHKWLIRQRIYCEHPGCRMTMRKGTHVVKFNGKDEVRCDHHRALPGPIEQGYRIRQKQMKET